MESAFLFENDTFKVLKKSDNNSTCRLFTSRGKKINSSKCFESKASVLYCSTFAASIYIILITTMPRNHAATYAAASRTQKGNSTRSFGYMMSVFFK
jgi:hypothetical protein